MVDIYEFIKTIKNNNYEFTPEELKKLVKSVKHERDYYKQKMYKIIDEIVKLGYIDDYRVDTDYNDYGEDTIYCIDFMGDGWTLHFGFGVNDADRVTINYEAINTEDVDYEIEHSECIGRLSTKTFTHIIDLFKTHGKYANINNPDVVTLFNNFNKSHNMKSARTKL